MRLSGISACHLMMATLVGIGPAYSQGVNDGSVAVHPTRPRASGSPDQATLPPPPPGPIESRLVPLPDADKLHSPSGSRPVHPQPASASEKTIAVIPFAGASPNLTEGTRAELEQVAKLIDGQHLRQIELRAFAGNGDLESRKIALARALVVRAYLIDLGVKSRIEVGSFSGEGHNVEILVP